MSKLNAGKASVLALAVVFAVSAFLFGKSITPVKAITCSEGQLLLDGVCYDPGDNGKFDWCHCGTDHCNSINVPLASLLNAGHVDASGNILHNGDHIGQCTGEEPTPTPTASPTATPTATPTADCYCNTNGYTYYSHSDCDPYRTTL